MPSFFMVGRPKHTEKGKGVRMKKAVTMLLIMALLGGGVSFAKAPVGKSLSKNVIVKHDPCTNC